MSKTLATYKFLGLLTVVMLLTSCQKEERRDSHLIRDMVGTYTVSIETFAAGPTGSSMSTKTCAGKIEKVNDSVVKFTEDLHNREYLHLIDESDNLVNAGTIHGGTTSYNTTVSWEYGIYKLSTSLTFTSGSNSTEIYAVKD